MQSLPSRHMAECRQQEGYDDASTWHLTAKARQLMTKVVLLDEFIDSGIAHGINVGSLEDQAIELEEALETMRREMIEEACPGEEPEGEYDFIDDFTPTVTQALEEFRRERAVTVFVETREAA